MRLADAMTGHADYTSEGHGEEMTQQERRKNPRTKLGHIIYVTLESGNGGIVLDISEGGLALQTADRIDATGPMQFRFLASAIQGIQAGGEICWTDASQKRGGVRFTDLPAPVLHEIRSWISNERAPKSESPVVQQPQLGVPDVHQAAPVEQPAARVETEVPPKPLFPNSAPQGERKESENVTDAWLKEAGGVRWREPSKDFPDHTRGLYAQHLEDTKAPWHWSATAVLVLLVLGMLGVIGYVYKAQVAQALVALGNRISPQTVAKQVEVAPPPTAPLQAANTQVPPAPSIEASAPKPPPQTVNTTSIANSDANENQKRKPVKRTESPESSQSAPAISTNMKLRGDQATSKLDGQAELQLAQQYLNQGNRDGAADLLWVSVEKGDAEAEVELADLYGRGDGVQKNCRQARVLVDAAREKDDDLASEEAATLNRLGCR
jgi:hypothetical protein